MLKIYRKNVKIRDLMCDYSHSLVHAENLYLNGELVIDLVIPDSVTSIGGSVFSDCTSLTSVTFEDATGWYVTKSYGASSVTHLNLSDASQNARYLNRTYDDYIWYNG